MLQAASHSRGHHAIRSWCNCWCFWRECLRNLGMVIWKHLHRTDFSRFDFHQKGQSCPSILYDWSSAACPNAVPPRRANCCEVRPCRLRLRLRHLPPGKIPPRAPRTVRKGYNIWDLTSFQVTRTIFATWTKRIAGLKNETFLRTKLELVNDFLSTWDSIPSCALLTEISVK